MFSVQKRKAGCGFDLRANKLAMLKEKQLFSHTQSILESQVDLVVCLGVCLSLESFFPVPKSGLTR